MTLPERRALAELDDLHVLICIEDHGEILKRVEPRGNGEDEVPSEQLRPQCVQGAHGDAHL